jgi:sugar lactone lactonase YvrE
MIARSLPLWLVAFGFAAPSDALADDGPRGVYHAMAVPGSPVLLASGMAWSDKGLFIADRKEKRIVALRPSGEFETVRKMTNPFGVGFDPDGNLIVSEKIDANHIVRIQGEKLQELVEAAQAGTPHALAVHKNGTIYWSGFPDGGTRSRRPDGQVAIEKPRIGHTFGIALGPKQDWLYVTSKLPDKERRQVWRFPVSPDGTLGEGRPFFGMNELKPKLADLPPPQDQSDTLVGWIGRLHGLAVDAGGRFYVGGAEMHTSGAAVAVISPDGKEVLAMILDVPRNIASLALSGDGRTLYIAGAGEYRLYSVSLDQAATKTRR